MRTHGAGANRAAGQVWAHWARADRLLGVLRPMRTHWARADWALRLMRTNGARTNRPLRQMRAHRARANGAPGNMTIPAGAVWRRAARTSAWGWRVVSMRAVGGAAAGSRCGRRRMHAVRPAVADRRPRRVVVPGAGAAGDDGLGCEGPGDGGETGLQGSAGP